MSESFVNGERGGRVGDEDRDGVRSRSGKILLALVKDSSMRRALSDMVLFFLLLNWGKIHST